MVLGLAFRMDGSRVFCGDDRLAGHGCIALQGLPPLCHAHNQMSVVYRPFRSVGRRDDLRIDPPALGDTTICLTTPSFQLHSSSTPMARRVSPTLTSYPSITGFRSGLHCASYLARLKTAHCFRLSGDTRLAVTGMVCSPSPSSTGWHVSGRMHRRHARYTVMEASLRSTPATQPTTSRRRAG